MINWFSLVLGVLFLAGCSGDPAGDRDNAGEREAEGEVLGGSISDEMIPLERLQSQSRSLRAAPTPGQEDDETGETSEEAGDATDQEAGPTAEPAEPATEETPA